MSSKPSTLAHIPAEQWLREHGHGHVIARLDGRKNDKCGGPTKCGVCAVEVELWRLTTAVKQSTCRHPLNREMWIERKVDRRAAYVCRECAGFIGWIATEAKR